MRTSLTHVTLVPPLVVARHLSSAQKKLSFSGLGTSVPFRSFYERLLAKGKAKKVALIAAMRKLLAILNSMAKHRSRWNPMLHDT